MCLGARAEATLPSDWWRETLCAVPRQCNALHMYMCGPELPVGLRRPVHVGLSAGDDEDEDDEEEEEAVLTLHFYGGLFHELKSDEGKCWLLMDGFRSMCAGMHNSEWFVDLLIVVAGRHKPGGSHALCHPLV